LGYSVISIARDTPWLRLRMAYCRRCWLHECYGWEGPVIRMRGYQSWWAI